MNRLLVLLLLSFCGYLQAQVGTISNVSIEEFDQMMTEHSNWGRWGKDDQLGTVNLITPKKRTQAASLVREGISISLSRDMDKSVGSHNPNPLMHKMLITEDAATDIISINYHGLNTTHLDGLAHFFYKGKIYNGVSAEVVTEHGAEVLGIEHMAKGIFTRGVLVDLAEHKGVPFLGHSEAILPEHLDAWETSGGIDIRPGDAVFIRTGKWSRLDQKGPENSLPFGGLHVSTVTWFKDKHISVFGTDIGAELYPSGVEGVLGPVHVLFLVAMGMPIFDNLDLEHLSRHCKETGRYEFLLTTAPLRIPGGTGSPVNPIAIF